MDDEELDQEELEKQEEQEQEENKEEQGPNPEKAKDEVKEKIDKAKKIKEKIQKVEKAQKSAKKAQKIKAAAEFASGAKKFAILANPYFWIALLIIIAIIVLIGIIMSLTIMPSNFLGKAKKFVEGMMQQFCGFVWGDNTSPISNGSEDVKDLANYIQNMGYDIQGYGFGDVEYTKETKKQQEEVKKSDEAANAIEGKRNYVTQEQATQGGEIKKVYGLQAVTTVSKTKYEDGDEMYSITGRFSSKNNDYLRAYLSAEAATYTEATYSIKGLFNELGDLLKNTLGDIFGFNDKDDWEDPGDVGIKSKSTGMLNFTNAGGNNILNSTLDGSPTKIKVDAKNKKLILYEHALSILGLTSIQWGQTFSIDLSDWTAVYGRPLELFLALHLSSMMPDLPYQIAVDQAFNTKVNINLEDVKIYFDTTVTLDGHRVTFGGDFGGAINTLPGATGLPPNVQACYNLWHSKGLSDVQIAAILGNAYRECGGVDNWHWETQKAMMDAGEDLKLGNVDGSSCTLAGYLPGYGLEHLQRYANAVGKDYSDATTQAEFLYYTLWGEYAAKCQEEKGDAAYQIILDDIKGSGVNYMTTAQWKNYSGQYPYESSFRDSTSPSSAAWAYFICYEGMAGNENQAHFCRECAEYWYQRIQSSGGSSTGTGGNTTGTGTGTATSDTDKLLILGDSWVYHLGDYYHLLPSSTYYHGEIGCTSSYYNKSNMSGYDGASAVVICLGINSTASSLSTAQSLANDISRMTSDLKELYPDKTIYVCKTPHVGRHPSSSKNPEEWNSNIDAYNEIVQSNCDGNKVVFIDPTDAILDSEGYIKEEYGGDYHLTSDGYKAWYDRIVQCVKEGTSAGGTSGSSSGSGSGSSSSGGISLSSYLPSANADRKRHNYDALSAQLNHGNPVQVTLIDDNGETFTVSLSQEDLKNLLKLIESGIKGADIKWPHIESVTNHWYYHIIDFYGTAAEDSPYGVYKKAKVAKKTIKYGDDEGGLDGFEIELTALLTSDSGIYYQVCEPYLNKEPSKYLKTIFHGAYYKYDGTTETARKIAAARAIEAKYGTDDYNDKDFEKDPEKIVKKKIKYNWHSSDSDSSKLEVTLEDATEYVSAKKAQLAINAKSEALIHEDNNHVEEANHEGTEDLLEEEEEEGSLPVDEMSEESPMCKKLVDFKSDKSNTLEAFSILENVNSEAADVNYRLLKKLMVEMDYFTEDDMNSHEKNILLWITNVEGTKGEDVAATINRNLGKTDNGENKSLSDTSRDANEYGVIISNFMENTQIIAPGDAKVKKVGSDEHGEFIEIEFTTLTDDKVYPLQGTMMLLHQDNEQDPNYNIETPYDSEPLYSAAEVMRRYRFRETYQVFEDDDLVGITMKISGLHDIKVSAGDTVLRGEEIAGTPKIAEEGEEDSGDKIYVSMKKADKTKIENVEDYIDPVYTYEDEKDMAEELWYLDHPEHGNFYGVTPFSYAYIQFAREMAADDDRVGYYQSTRMYKYNAEPNNWDVDCSALVYYSLQETGWNPGQYCDNYPFTTSNEGSVLISLGFTEHEFTGYEDCKNGDVLWNSGHTGLYSGSNGENKTIEAHGPTSKIIHHQPGIDYDFVDDAAGHGDQSGHEVSEGASGSTWEKYYRPPANGGGSVSVPDSSGDGKDKGKDGSHSSVNSDIDYVKWAIDIANDDRYYYDHSSSPWTFSCSTFVGTALYKTGHLEEDICPADGSAIGGEGDSRLHRAIRKAGFKEMSAGEVGGFDGLKPGDIFTIGSSYHVAIYIGNGLAVSANGPSPASSNFNQANSILVYNADSMGYLKTVFRLPS